LLQLQRDEFIVSWYWLQTTRQEWCCVEAMETILMLTL